MSNETRRVWHTKCPRCKEVYKWYTSPRKIQRKCIRCNIYMMEVKQEKPAPQKQPGLFDTLFE